MNKPTDKSLAELFDEFRAICAEEGYRLKLPERRNRRNDFLELLDSTAGSRRIDQRPRCR